MVAAKSEQSTDRLPGSIHETADAIRALGRRALAVATDVRDEDAIRNLIENTIAEFGRLDILVNNAGAIWAQPILQTPPKRFDLMMGVNVRAAYIACYYALPHMVKQQWGHILNMCPRLSSRALAGKSGLHAFPNSAWRALAHRAGRRAQAGQHRRQHAVAAHHHREPGFHQLENGRPLAVAHARDPLRCLVAIFAQEPRTCTGREWIDEQALTELAGYHELRSLLVRGEGAGGADLYR